MKVQALTGALLSYWTGRADGKEAEDLAIYEVPRTDITICIYKGMAGWERYMPSADWKVAGPMLEAHHLWISDDGDAECIASKIPHVNDAIQTGPTVIVAVCRAIVYSKFGEEVPDAEHVTINPQQL